MLGQSADYGIFTLTWHGLDTWGTRRGATSRHLAALSRNYRCLFWGELICNLLLPLDQWHGWHEAACAPHIVVMILRSSSITDTAPEVSLVWGFKPSYITIKILSRGKYLEKLMPPQVSTNLRIYHKTKIWFDLKRILHLFFGELHF